MTGCRGVSVTGLQVVNARTRGITLDNCNLVRIAQSTILGAENDAGYRAAINVAASCTRIMVNDHAVSRGTEGDAVLPMGAGQAAGNTSI